MAKGSKKYASHEYSFASPAKAGLGKDLAKHKSEAASSRATSNTYPKKMADGGTVTPSSQSSSTASSVGGRNLDKGGYTQGANVGSSANLTSTAGNFFAKMANKAQGGEIKAQNKEQKAEHKGNDKRDDKVPIMATEGEVMLPKSVTKAKDAPKKAANFMKKEMKKKK